MSKSAEKYILAAKELAEEMIRKADRIADTSDDDSSLVVFGVVRDCAYKILDTANRELHSMKNRKRKNKQDSVS